MAFKMLFRILKSHRIRLDIIFYIIVVYLQVNHAAHTYLNLPAVTFDVTKPLDAVLSGETSKQAFKQAVDSNVASGEKIQMPSLSLLYSSDCNILEPETCSKQISSVTLLLNETFGGSMKNFDLTICLTVDVPTILQISNKDYNARIQLPDQPLKILVNLHENTTCEDLKTISYSAWDTLIWKHSAGWIYFRPNTEVGFGYTEALMHCNGKGMGKALHTADFRVLNMGFGNTVGITESFGLFKNRMDALHVQNLQFITYNLDSFWTTEIPNPVYFPSATSVGQESYRRLLMKYAESWVSSVGEKSMIIQAPYFEQEIATNHFIVPFVQKKRCATYKYEIEDLMWYAPSALATVSKYFKSLVLTHGQWEKLQSEEVQTLYETFNMSNDENILLDVILDNSETLVYNDDGIAEVESCSYDWEKVEAQLEKRLIPPLRNIVPTILIFQVSNTEPIRMRANVPLEFAQRVSPKYKFGCSYMSPSFGSLNETMASNVVEACKEIGGSVYILKAIVNLESTNYQNNHLHYEDSVRKELEYVDRFRKLIFKTHPDSIVYVHLNFWPTRQVAIRENYQTTAFCNPAILEANFYIEAITNWAKFKNFPLILKSVFDSLQGPNFYGWLSFLRPVETSSYDSIKERRIAALNPSFVLRNYPEGINNWTVDPCIEWSRDTGNIGVDFFHNPFIGATFNTIDLIQCRTFKKGGL